MLCRIERITKDRQATVLTETRPIFDWEMFCLEKWERFQKGCLKPCKYLP